MEPWIESLVIFGLIIAHVAVGTLGVFIFWTAVFIPINKLREHQEKKKKLDEEIQKILIRKAETIEIIKDKRDEYDSLSKLCTDRKIELDKLEQKYHKISEAISTSKNKKKGSSSTSKSKNAESDDLTASE